MKQVILIAAYYANQNKCLTLNSINIMKPTITVNQYHQDTWTEHFPNPGSNKNDYTLYLSDPQAQYNKLLRTQQKLRNQKEMNILYHIIRIILSVGTILILIRNEKIYQAYKYTHPTNKIRYIISQSIILTLYTSSLILVSYTYRIILRYI